MEEFGLNQEQDKEFLARARKAGFKLPMAREELRDVIDIALWAGQLLLQHGAETARVEETVHRIGTGLGANWLDILVSPNAIVATTISGHEFRTKIRRVVNIGINMEIIVQISELSRRVSAGEADRFATRAALERIDAIQRNYNRPLTVLMVGLACGAFSQMFGGGLIELLITTLAAALAMLLRQELNMRHFNPLLVTMAVAFAAGVAGSFPAWLGLVYQRETVIASAVLLLVPGVHLINAAEDLIQGHLITGLARGVTGLLISFGIAVGVLLAMTLMGIPAL